MLNLDTGKAGKSGSEYGAAHLPQALLTCHRRCALDIEMVHFTVGLIFHCSSPDFIFTCGKSSFY